MDSREIAADVEVACRRLVIAFARYLDSRRFGDVAALFADDGVWLRRGVSMRGGSEILVFLERRPQNVVERHIMTTTLVEQVSDTECTADSYAVIYRAELTGQALPTITGPDRIGEFHDRFRLTGEGWRFSFRTSNPTFTIADF